MRFFSWFLFTIAFMAASGVQVAQCQHPTLLVGDLSVGAPMFSSSLAETLPLILEEISFRRSSPRISFFERINLPNFPIADFLDAHENQLVLDFLSRANRPASAFVGTTNTINDKAVLLARWEGVFESIQSQVSPLQMIGLTQLGIGRPIVDHVDLVWTGHSFRLFQYKLVPPTRSIFERRVILSNSIQMLADRHASCLYLYPAVSDSVFSRIVHVDIAGTATIRFEF